MSWAQGQAVRITYRGEACAGTIQLASENGRSLMLAFDAFLGGYAGMMPVLGDENGENYRDLLLGELVLIEPAP